MSPRQTLSVAVARDDGGELGRLVRHTGASKRDEGLKRARADGRLDEEGFFPPTTGDQTQVLCMLVKHTVTELHFPNRRKGFLLSDTIIWHRYWGLYP